MREALGEKGFKREGYSFVPLKDFEIEKKFLEVVNKDKDIKILPGQMDQELANIISEEFKKKKIFFIDPNDENMTRALEKKIINQEATKELMDQVLKPITLEDAKALEKLAKPFKNMSELTIPYRSKSSNHVFHQYTLKLSDEINRLRAKEVGLSNKILEFQKK